MGRRTATLAAIAASTMGLAACGTKEFDPGKTEANLRTYLVSIGLPASKIKTLTCPSGVESKVGATFDCAVATTDGHKLKIKVTQTDKQVHLKLHTTVVK